MRPKALIVAFIVDLSIALLFATSAQAEELRYQAQVELSTQTSGYQAAELVLPRFPSDLGPLHGVRFETTVAAQAISRAENLAPVDHVLESPLMHALVVQLPSGDAVAMASLQSLDVALLAPFDGQADFAGASGYERRVATKLARVSAHEPSRVFIAAPQQGRLRLGLGSYSDLGNGNKTVQREALLRTRVTVEVVYTY